MNSTLTHDEGREITEGDSDENTHNENILPVMRPPEIMSTSQHTAYNNFPVSMSNRGK
jgi:hypothetical protein